jgi:hypothetical protein
MHTPVAALNRTHMSGGNVEDSVHPTDGVGRKVDGFPKTDIGNESTRMESDDAHRTKPTVNTGTHKCGFCSKIALVIGFLVYDPSKTPPTQDELVERKKAIAASRKRWWYFLCEIVGIAITIYLSIALAWGAKVILSDARTYDELPKFSL